MSTAILQQVTKPCHDGHKSGSGVTPLAYVSESAAPSRGTKRSGEFASSTAPAGSAHSAAPDDFRATIP